MSTFDFRLRFNFAPSFRLNSEESELHLFQFESGQEVTLKSGQPDTAIKDCGRVVIRAQGFASETDAREVAERVKRTLLYWSVRFRHGIDLGDRPPTSIVTSAGLEMLEKEHGCPFRNDLHGIDVYEHQDPLKLVYSDGKAVARKHPDRLLASFSEELERPRSMTIKQALACEIYCSSWFDVNHKSRFITLVTAIEALIDQERHPENVHTFVAATCDLLEITTIPASIKASLRGSLERMRRESISQAGRRLAAALLPDISIDNLSASACFAKLYNLRSQLVHDGAPGKDEEIRLACNTAEEFVAKLLLASLGGDAPT
jgi:hypothetical protein